MSYGKALNRRPSDQEGALMLTWGITLTTVVAALGQMSVMPILSVICVMKDVPAPLPQQLS